jgi:hypothetical protein
VSLRDWQLQLGKALILPDVPPLCELSALQGIEGRRLALYEELLFNTVLETLQNIYPYTYRLLSRRGSAEAEWKVVAESYRRAYPNQSYKLMGAVSSFPEFLSEQAALMETYPFLSDLALYEWIEMEVINLPDPAAEIDFPDAIPPLEKLAEFRPVWNPARRLHRFRFHMPEVLEQMKQSNFEMQNQEVLLKRTDILIYRDPTTLEARFFCLNELTAELIALSEVHPVSYQELLLLIQEQSPALKVLPIEIIAMQAYGLFETCLDNGILLGSNRV